MKRDRQFALTRCWSGGDSNRRSHPTESLCLSSYCTRKRDRAVRTATLVERREFEPPVRFVRVRGKPSTVWAYRWSPTLGGVEWVQVLRIASAQR
jgi:hypothetical protein